MAKAKTIRIACKGSRMAKLDSLEIIQGDLKELSEENYAKLRKRIVTKGFDAPLFVWEDKILDGTQRVRVLRKMTSDGWVLSKGEVPVCDIEAANLEEAKDRLLGYVSQYGKLTDAGLQEFLSTMEIPDLDTLDLPDFNLDAFRDLLPEGGTERDEIQHEKLTPYSRVHVLLSFPPEVLAEIQDRLNEITLHPQVEYEQGQN